MVCVNFINFSTFPVWKSECILLSKSQLCIWKVLPYSSKGFTDGYYWTKPVPIFKYELSVRITSQECYGYNEVQYSCHPSVELQLEQQRLPNTSRICISSKHTTNITLSVFVCIKLDTSFSSGQPVSSVTGTSSISYEQSADTSVYRVDAGRSKSTDQSYSSNANLVIIREEITSCLK